MRSVPLTCRQCGAPLVRGSGEGRLSCHHCGTDQLLEFEALTSDASTSRSQERVAAELAIRRLGEELFRARDEHELLKARLEGECLHALSVPFAAQRDAVEGAYKEALDRLEGSKLANAAKYEQRLLHPLLRGRRPRWIAVVLGYTLGGVVGTWMLGDIGGIMSGTVLAAAAGAWSPYLILVLRKRAAEATVNDCSRELRTVAETRALIEQRRTRAIAELDEQLAEAWKPGLADIDNNRQVQEIRRRIDRMEQQLGEARNIVDGPSRLPEASRELDGGRRSST